MYHKIFFTVHFYAFEVITDKILNKKISGNGIICAIDIRISLGNCIFFKSGMAGNKNTCTVLYRPRISRRDVINILPHHRSGLSAAYAVVNRRRPNFHGRCSLERSTTARSSSSSSCESANFNGLKTPARYVCAFIDQSLPGFHSYLNTHLFRRFNVVSV